MIATALAKAVVLTALLVSCAAPLGSGSGAAEASAPRSVRAMPTTSPTLSPTSSPTSMPETTPEPSAPSPSPSPSSVPAESPPYTIGYGDHVQVTDHGAGLAVRVSPLVTVAMVAGMVRSDETSGEWVAATPEVRLVPGDSVGVGLGPLCIEGMCWYEVYNRDPLVGWDADHDGQPEEPGRGWVAAADDGGPYLALASPPGPTDVFAASGQGSATPHSFTVHQEGIGVSVQWAMATGGLAPCNLVVSLQPRNQVLLSESLIGAFQEGTSLTHMLTPGRYDLEVSASVPNEPDAACPWAIAVRETQPGHVP